MAARRAAATRSATDMANPIVIDRTADHRCRSREGERLHHLYEERCEALIDEGRSDHLAVDDADEQLTYPELNERANQLARHLRARGVWAGSKVGLLLPRSAWSYAAILAVSKLHATFVPLDAVFPSDRISYIVDDADISLILTVAEHASLVEETADTDVVFVDVERREIDEQPGHQVFGSRSYDGEDDGVSYIIYTSGSTGRPKGVAVEHESICNFVRVAAECYGIRDDDRMYQGMTIAFDFSVEEIWVPLVVGATLVPNSTGQALLGEDLRAFLIEQRVTALCCVPTLLATVGDDLEQLRFLLVSGEACPQDLVERWYRPDRLFLNVYGPTEASVTATWTELRPGSDVTIGVPLPTYSAVILDLKGDRVIERGGEGELALAGVGLARGYVGRDDLTAAAFIPDFVGMPDNPSSRIYRTGDLARIDDHGEIVYLGRIDTQVKIRGYRIELTEIESVLMNVPGVAQAIVDTHEPTPGVVELAAWFTKTPGTTAVDVEAMLRIARDRLPPYMVPTYLDEVESFALLPSDKVDRKKLPQPVGRRSNIGAIVEPGGETERVCAAALSEILGMESVSVTDHFFDDLGASSLLMASYTAALRERTERSDLGMRDLYEHPTVRTLATMLDDAPTAESSADGAPQRPQRPIHIASRAAYFTTGILQIALATAITLANMHLIVWSVRLVFTASGPVEQYVRGATGGLVIFVSYTAIAIAAKWLLVGRWRVREYTIWTPDHARIWLPQLLIRLSPMRVFAGSPIYNTYLRLLGMKIGKGAVIQTSAVPICSDLVTIGPRTVIRRGASISAIKAEAGVLRTGTITIGADSYVGVRAHLDIGTVVGDHAQLGHASALHEGRSIPDHSSYHGSPAEPCDTLFDRLGGLDEPSSLRKVGFTIYQFVMLFLVAMPFTLWLTSFMVSLGPDRPVVAVPVFLFGVLMAAVVGYGVPRALAPTIDADRIYPLYGVRYALSGIISSTANIKFLNLLLGDSSYIVGHVRRVGLRFRGIKQTGSNFGVEHRWDTPAHIEIGSGTMVSDGFDIANTDLGFGGFRHSLVTIGSDSYLGNAVVYAAGTPKMENVLIGTRTMVPIDGGERSGIGLLGSPAFEIPRETTYDADLDHPTEGPVFTSALRRKNRSNIATMGLFLVLQFLSLYVTVFALTTAARLLPGRLEEALVLGAWIALLLQLAQAIVLERLLVVISRDKPLNCSIYDPKFWRHERCWKLVPIAVASVFAGTPLMGTIWRLMGVRVGRQLYDGGLFASERSLLTIGDNCTINASIIQGHSMEEGIFKSGPIELGNRVTIEPNVFVHYSTTIGDDAVIRSDAFLMKGERVEPGATWIGNPARPETQAEPDVGALSTSEEGRAPSMTRS